MSKFKSFAFKMSAAVTSLFLLFGCRKDDTKIPAAKLEASKQENLSETEKQILNTEKQMGAEPKAEPPSDALQKDVAIAFKPENFLHKSEISAEIKNTDPEGLYVRGPFLPSRPTLIYVHGWIAESGVSPEMPNDLGWQKAGFNTVFMRWHAGASDSAKGCPGGGGVFGIPNIPCNAEARIYGQRGTNPAHFYAGEKFVKGYKALFENLNSPGEIRIVGHSAGSQMAAYLAYRLYREKYAGAKPNRVDLLDPFASGEDPGEPHENYIIPEDQETGAGACGENTRKKAYCRLENSMQFLKAQGVAMLTLRASVSVKFTHDLHLVMPVVELSNKWLGGDAAKQHVKAVNWYMCGISAVPTKTEECEANPNFAVPLITRGAADKLSQLDALSHSSVFNWLYYKTENTDLSAEDARTPQTLLAHWQTTGASQCRIAHPYFSVKEYKSVRADVALLTCPEAMVHYVNIGLSEENSPIPMQPVLGAKTPTALLARLGGTRGFGISFIHKIVDGSNYDTPSSHDDKFKY